MTTVSVAIDEAAFSGGEVVVPELPGVMGRGEFPRGNALEVVLQALSLWGYRGVVGNPRVAQYVRPTWEISWVPLVAGLAVAVAAEVFRQGIRLRDDVPGTV